MNQLLDCMDIFTEGLCCAGYLWTSDKFCKRYLRISGKNEGLFIFFSFSCWILINTANLRMSIPSFFLMVLNHLFFIELVVLLFQEHKGKKFLAASVLIAIITLTENFCHSFLSCLMLVFLHTVKKIPEPFLSKRAINLIVFISACLAILTIYWMTEHFESVFYIRSERWYILFAVPLLVITMVIDAANWGAANGIMVRSGKNMGLYYDQLFSHAEILVLTGLSIFAAGFYLFGMNRIYWEQEKNSQYHAQIAVYQLLEEQYRQSERLRHDMKNHIIALSGLFQGNEWEKIGAYLKNMEGSLEMGGDITGNKAVDALLYQKWKWAEKEKIKWECDIQIPKICRINEFELCILLGNILDNALKACEKLLDKERRFICIQAKTVKKCFLLEVKNSMNTAEQHTRKLINQGNFPKYGIGLLNVTDVVQRYNGVMEIKAENGVFTLSILMPLTDAAHNINPTI